MASERLRRIIKQPRVSARRKRRSVDGGDSPSSSDSSLNSRHKRHGIDDNRRRADRSASRERNSAEVAQEVMESLTLAMVKVM